MTVCTPVEIYTATALWVATRSPCLLRHGGLVYCDMVALLTQSEGKPITVLRQPVPCFHMSTWSKFSDIGRLVYSTHSMGTHRRIRCHLITRLCYRHIAYIPFSHMIEISVRHQGAVSIRKTVLPGMAIPMLKIRRPNGRLIFNMEIAIRR